MSFPGPAVWLKNIRKEPSRPKGPATFAVLAMLTQRLNWKTGAGYASEQDLAEDVGDIHVETVRRALRWAIGAGHLNRTRQGHRITGDRVVKSEWQLILVPALIPTTYENAVGEDKPTTHDNAVGETQPHIEADPTTHEDATSSSPSDSPPGKEAHPHEDAREDDPTSSDAWSVSFDLLRHGSQPSAGLGRQPPARDGRR